MNRIIPLLLILTSHNLNWCIDINKIIHNNSLIPPNTDLRNRVLTTISCTDCNHLPRVENAGKVFMENNINFQLMHNGLKIIKDCYYGSWMTCIIEKQKGIHEPQEEKIFNEILKYVPSNSVMLELGAYWGYYSMWFLKQVSNSRTYLIEPDPKNIIIGKKNFLLNGFIGTFIQAMVGQTNKESEIFIDWDYNKHQIPQICVDNFAKENNIDFVYILHSDIQGAEIDMLKGCKNLIKQRKIGYFFISTHRGTHEECLKILIDSELEILVSHTREESFSADGLIVAKLPELPGPKTITISRRTKEFCDIVDKIANEKH